uniref:Secreted protein n=1 Tax=Steinernema glaseri TaxID=37863 RepID=A0A1I7XWW5_9BILA
MVELLVSGAVWLIFWGVLTLRVASLVFVRLRFVRVRKTLALEELYEKHFLVELLEFPPQIHLTERDSLMS